MLFKAHRLKKLSSPVIQNNFPPRHRSPTRLLSASSNNDDAGSLRPDIAFILKHYRIHRREKDGTHGMSREYLLLPPDTYIPQVVRDPSLPAAALFAHRNVVFGARSFHGYDMEDVCLPLVKAAIEDTEQSEVTQGQHPQAVVNLKGLSEWVAGCFENNHEGSQTLKRLAQECGDGSNEGSGLVSLEAARAIATGVPRPGHSVVGQGTFRDGQEVWKELAKEYVDLGMSKEANLYEKQGGKLVNIEHLADQSAENMRSAGGAIGRMFFL